MDPFTACRMRESMTRLKRFLVSLRRPQPSVAEDEELRDWFRDLDPPKEKLAEFRLAYEYSLQHNRLIGEAIVALDEKASRLFDLSAVLLAGLITLYTTTNPLRTWPTLFAFLAFIISTGLMVWVRKPVAWLPGTPANDLIDNAQDESEAYLLGKLAASLHRSTVSMRSVMEWKADVVLAGSVAVLAGLLCVVVAIIMHAATSWVPPAETETAAVVAPAWEAEPAWERRCRA